MEKFLAREKNTDVSNISIEEYGDLELLEQGKIVHGEIQTVMKEDDNLMAIGEIEALFESMLTIRF